MDQIDLVGFYIALMNGVTEGITQTLSQLFFAAQVDIVAGVFILAALAVMLFALTCAPYAVTSDARRWQWLWEQMEQDAAEGRGEGRGEMLGKPDQPDKGAAA